jgi:hypothetical protein
LKQGVERGSAFAPAIVRRETLRYGKTADAPIASAHGAERRANAGAAGHVELVAKDSELVLCLFDAQNKPLSAKGHRKATVLVAGQQKTLMLVAGDDSAMRGKGRFAAAPGNEGARFADAAGPEDAVGPIYTARSTSPSRAFPRSRR